jgi:outer membrane lipopolysaccharide assembly protein LptE/RlpB
METTSRSIFQKLASFAAIVAASAIAGCDSQVSKSGGPSTVCTLQLVAGNETELQDALDRALRSASPCDPAGLRTQEPSATSARAVAGDLRAASVEVVAIEQEGNSLRAQVRVTRDDRSGSAPE